MFVPPPPLHFVCIFVCKRRKGRKEGYVIVFMVYYLHFHFSLERCLELLGILGIEEIFRLRARGYGVSGGCNVRVM